MENTLQFEEWRPVVGYVGLYEVSSFGRIRSVDRIDSNNHKRFGRIMKQSPDKDGYLRTTLTKNGKQKTCKIHRLVAEAFIPNPNKLPCINHKTDCKTFNHFSALEWCDVKYNNEYGYRIKMKKKIKQYSNDHKLIREWPSAFEVEMVLGFKHHHILDCCKGKYKQAYGFKWEYAENNREIA